MVEVEVFTGEEIRGWDKDPNNERDVFFIFSDIHKQILREEGLEILRQRSRTRSIVISVIVGLVFVIVASLHIAKIL